MFAERLKEARKAKRYSQAEVSRMLGVTQQAVGKWETGRSTPDPQTVARLAEITGFPKLFPINENSNDPSIDKNKQIRRVIFPKSEYANNAGAVNAATRLLGGPDSGGTRLWWDAR